MAPRLKSFQTNFSAGEVQPEINARLDIAQFKNGARQLRDWRQLVQGGVRRRPGMAYLYDVTALGPDVQAEDFIFNDDQIYTLVFSNGQLDIFNEADGTLVQSTAGMPWTTAMMNELDVAQSLDTMIVTHEDLKTQVIKRTSATTFTINDFAFETGTGGTPTKQPYHKFASDATTLSSTATTGAVTLTANAAVFNTGHGGGGIIRYQGQEILITSYISSTQVTGIVLQTLVGTAPTSLWDEAAVSPGRGWWRTCRFSNSRLIFWGSRDLPNFIACSRTNGFFNFAVGTAQDNEAIFEEVVENQVVDARGLTSTDQIQLFSSELEFLVPVTDTRPLTPANFGVKKQTKFGCSKIKPKEGDGFIFYMPKNRASLRKFEFSDTSQKFKSNPLSLLSGHLLSDPADLEVHLEGEKQQEQYAYVRNTDGTVAVFLNVLDEQVAGWALWTTDGKIKAILVNNRRLYSVTERTINAVTKYYLERYDQNHLFDASVKATDVTEKSIWTGFTHLADNLVHVASGGIYLGEYQCDSSGDIDLTPFAVDNVEVGLNFNPVLETLPPEFQLTTGVTFGSPRGLVRAIVDLVDTDSITVQGKSLVTRQTTDDLSLPPASVTGKREFWLRGWGTEGTVTITQKTPGKCTLNGVLVEVNL